MLAPQDYTETSEIVTLPSEILAGRKACALIKIEDDMIEEQKETFMVDLMTPAGIGTPNGVSSVVSIRDNDGSVSYRDVLM